MPSSYKAGNEAKKIYLGLNSASDFFKSALYEQAGTGPSGCHIYGSKIEKGLQNVKVLVNWRPFEVI